MKAISEGALRLHTVPPLTASPLHNLQLVVVSPDATTTGRHRDVLRTLTELGCGCVAARWHRFDAPLVAALYAETRQRDDPSQPPSELVDSLFCSDHSLVCLVARWDRRGHGRPLSVALNRLKGPSDPALCAPGHLRWELGAENQVLNFVHMSDDPDSLRTEACLLFGDDAPLQDMHAFVAIPRPPPDLGHRPSASVFDTLARLKEQVVRQGLGEVPATVAALFADERSVAARPRRGAPDVARLSALRDAERAWATRVGADHEPWDEVLGYLLEVDVSALDAARVVEAVATVAEAPDPWDVLVLRCQERQRRPPAQWEAPWV